MKFTNIDELFKNKLKNHQVEPPANVWNNISQELDNIDSIDDMFKKSLYQKEVKPPAYVWDNINATLDKLEIYRKTRIWWFLGSGAAVIIAFIAGYFIANSLQNESKSQSVVVSQQIQKISENTSQLTLENTATNTEKRNNRLNLSSVKILNEKAFSNAEESHSMRDSQNKNASSNFKSTVKQEKQVSTKSISRTSGKNRSNKNQTELLSPKQSDSRNDVVSTNSTSNENKLTNELTTENDQHIFVSEKQVNEKFQANQTIQNHQENEVKTHENFEKTKNIDLYEGLDPISSYYPIFSVSPFFSPMYVIRNSHNDENKYDPIAPGSDDRFKHTTNFSYQAGLLLGYNFSRNISLHIGCSYNQITHSTRRGDLQTTPFNQISIYDTALAVQTSAGELTGLSVDPNLDNPQIGPIINIEQTILHSPLQRVVQTIGFVEVPVLLKYRIATTRVGFLLTGGLSTGFVVQNDAFAENQLEYIRFGETANIRNVNFNLVLGAGLDVQINPWLYFTFEPTFRYSMMNWSTKDDVKINPIMIGANTGLSFRF